MKIISLRENPAALETFIGFFAAHWGNEAVYRDCMSACLVSQSPLPQWYLLMASDGVIGGCGLIANDFNSRQDLWPWLCALYIEEAYRGRNLGAVLLEHGTAAAARLGFASLYLCTDHVGYYEKYGFQFLSVAHDPFGGSSRVYECATLLHARENQSYAGDVKHTADEKTNSPNRKNYNFVRKFERL